MGVLNCSAEVFHGNVKDSKLLVDEGIGGRPHDSEGSR